MHLFSQSRMECFCESDPFSRFFWRSHHNSSKREPFSTPLPLLHFSWRWPGGIVGQSFGGRSEPPQIKTRLPSQLPNESPAIKDATSLRSCDPACAFFFSLLPRVVAPAPVLFLSPPIPFSRSPCPLILASYRFRRQCGARWCRT